jgi:uncharacterized protein (DUF433 family)
MSAKPKTYPHITRNKAILHGVPIVEGTRTPVRAIACYYQMGLTVEEILDGLPSLSRAQVHSALAYYFDHQKEIDRDTASNNDIARWKKLAAKLAKQPA